MCGGDALGVEMFLPSVLETFVSPSTSTNFPTLALFSEVPYLCRISQSV